MTRTPPPRATRAAADRHHEAIEVAASRLFRTRGFAAVSVAELMAEAGLTHGGFYAHFASKAALAAAACRTAFAQAAAKWQRRIDGAPSKGAALDAITSAYLHPANREATSPACPTATLASDVAREPKGDAVQHAYVEGLRGQIEMLATLHDSGDGAADRKRACVQLATMAGALVLARAARGDVLSDELLDAVREALLVAPSADAASAAPTSNARRAPRRGLPKQEPA